jgi:hypothetical protein
MPIQYENFPDETGAIQKAIDALAAIPFSSWPNRNIQNGLISGIIALAYDYKDPRRNAALLYVIGVLQKELADGFEQQHKQMAHAAQLTKYYLDGKLEDAESFPDPAQTVLEVVNAFHEKQRREAKA